MQLLFSIVQAAHAKGTHHYLALDALRSLACRDADAWQRLFLKHAVVYLEGSKAPDDKFKDFKNHVLHPRDGLWGGAPEAVRSWYQHLVEALSRQDWPGAAYSAGVLSHYYTDPLQPLHTGQSEAENNIHRAVEWSISKAYKELRAQGVRERPVLDVGLADEANWLADLVVANAEMANADYEKLIAHYDFQRGVVDPPEGLDPVARRILSRLIRHAYVSFAAVLGRAIEEANVKAPQFSLTGPMLLAAANIPRNILAKRFADAQERRLVEAMYDELQATGTVEKTLAEDDRAVRDLHAAEVLAKRPASPAVSQVLPLKPREKGAVVASRTPVDATAGPAAGNVVALRGGQQQSKTNAPAERAMGEQPVGPGPKPQPASPPLISLVPDAGSRVGPARPRAGLTDRLDRVVVKPVAEAPGSDEARFHLTLDDEVVKAPSIGPKTADRLQPHGIRTVRDLLKADPAALAGLVASRHILPDTITQWQDQARLVCTVAGLRGTHAQLLVGAGYRTLEALVNAEPDKLCSAVLEFAGSTAGQRLLRNGDPPDMAKIKSWLAAARGAKAA